MCLKFENLRKIDWKSYFWEIWVQYYCFWKAFHLIFMHFIHKILCFEDFLHKIALFFKNLIFPDVRSIEPVARPIEIVIKILVWICSFRLVLDRCWINWKHFWSIESNFRSIKNRIESFFKTLSFHVFFTIQNFFKKLFLSLSLRLVRFKVTQIFSRVFVFIHQ